MATNVQSVNPTLEATWRPPVGIMNWLTAVNHRSIGTRYIWTGMAFFLVAGIAALLMRIQLAFPQFTFLNPDLYNQIFTMHGTTMMFLFAVPIMEGVGIYLTPMMIGARDMAFPKLNAFGYWVYLISGVTIWLSLLIGQAPDGGWFAYVPLTGPEYSPGIGIDFYVTLISLLEVAALVAAIELIVTIFKLRAPGMTINRIPLFVWAILVMAFMIVFAMPPLMVASIELALDRTVGMQFFNPDLGGDPLLWQHLFWFFGHPEVYIILVPALGIVSAIVATFSRRPVIGYNLLVLSFIAIGFLSFGLWVHHMFTTGLPPLGLSFFSVASIMIAIPSGVQIFSIIATLWSGRVWPRAPLLFIFGFVIVFVLGGITGVMVASVPFDWQVHDTYFVVAHFHYVLIGGAVFPLFGGLYYWFPKLTGRMLDENLGRWHFWLLFIGINVTFLPMHLTGFWGMPRRVYTYLDGLGWNTLNLVSSFGTLVIAAAVIVFLANVLRSRHAGEIAGDDPWSAGTLEWATTSPPQNFNFREVPIVNHREPLWFPEPVDTRPVREAYLSSPQVVELQDWRRETLGTTLLDARPEMRVILPSPTIIPFLLALAVAFTFIGFMIDVILVPIGALLVFIAIAFWHWPKGRDWSMEPAFSGEPDMLMTSTIATSRGAQPPIYWGMIGLILIETVVFGSLISSYFYLRSGESTWPLGGISRPELLLPSINALILFSSSIPIYIADRGIRNGNQQRLQIGLAIGFLLGLIFLTLKYIEYSSLDYNWTTNAYGSIVWTITGFHSAHVIALLLKTLVVGVLALKGYYNAERNVGIVTNGIYWHFVVAAWVPLFFTLYISPYLF